MSKTVSETVSHLSFLFSGQRMLAIGPIDGRGQPGLGPEILPSTGAPNFLLDLRFHGLGPMHELDLLSTFSGI
jgi:hypothetical protein